MLNEVKISQKFNIYSQQDYSKNRKFIFSFIFIYNKSATVVKYYDKIVGSKNVRLLNQIPTRFLYSVTKIHKKCCNKILYLTWNRYFNMFSLCNFSALKIVQEFLFKYLSRKNLLGWKEDWYIKSKTMQSKESLSCLWFFKDLQKQTDTLNTRRNKSR